jgi:uncharacterized repeat protein (TIGR03803 family)
MPATFEFKWPGHRPRGETIKRGRLAIAVLSLAIFAIVILPLGHDSAASPQAPTVGQGGAVQMPLRLCVLHNFGDKPGEPATPKQTGTMVQRPPGDDNFYSTTPVGGAHNLGTVFMVTPSGDLTVLYSFPGGINGSVPTGGLTLGRDGYLYGTTPSGGKYNVGTIFKISRSGGTPTIISTQIMHRLRPELASEPASSR